MFEFATVKLSLSLSQNLLSQELDLAVF